MAQASQFAIPESRWSDDAAAALSPEQALLYRSNLLGGGSDLTITNFGGGNTSGKIAAKDPLTGERVGVLWVKGSGGDIGSMKLDGFATLYLDKLLGLEKLYRGVAHEDEMVGYLAHCTFNLNPRAASIDTPLHAFLPFADVDHVHPDAVIALAASSQGREATRRSMARMSAGCPGSGRVSIWDCACAITSPAIPACAASCWRTTV
ncbi:MAG: hypothetical protein WDN03_11085 [Rhizomicrobium sp.]